METQTQNEEVVQQPALAELPSGKQLFAEAWEIYKARFNTLLLISIIPIAAYILAAGLFGGGGWLAVYMSNTFHISLIGFGIAGFLLALVAIILLVYLGVWGTVAEVFAIKDHAEAIGWKESYKRSKVKVNDFFSTNLLAGLAVVGGCVLLVVPGIIFALWFSQVSYIVVVENLKNTAALKQSKSYVKGRLGAVFGKLFYIGIITVALYLAVGIVLVGLYKVLGIPASSDSAAQSLPSNIVSIVWTPLVTCYSYVLYKALKASKTNS